MKRTKGHSNIGGRKDQQDNYLVWSYKGMFCIGGMDGAGGHDNGAEASKIAKTTINTCLGGIDLDIKPDELSSRLSNIIKMTHEAITKNKKAGKTTIALACIKDNLAHIVWVGDSKVYLLRNSKLFCLTLDHSQVHEFVIRRMITKDDAQDHPNKNILTRAVGGGNAEPDGVTISLEEGDELLITTDGVDDVFNEDQIQEILLNCNKQDKAKHLVEMAVKAGTRDNVTAVYYLHKMDSYEPVSNCYSLQAARVSEVDTQKSDTEYQIDIYSPQGIKKSQNLIGEKVIVGRDGSNEVSIADDPYMNTRHFELKKDGDGFVVSDLNSFNGCYIKLTEPTRLTPPFEIIAGQHRLCLSSKDSSAKEG